MRSLLAQPLTKKTTASTSFRSRRPSLIRNSLDRQLQATSIIFIEVPSVVCVAVQIAPFFDGQCFFIANDEGLVERRRSIAFRVPIAIGDKVPANGVVPVPNSRGIELVWSIRGVPDADIDGGLPKGTCSLSMFVVNRRKVAPDELRDEGLIFQVELELQIDTSFVARPNLRSLESGDWDERVADLQYRDVFEFSVGHSVSTDAVVEDGGCRTVRTCCFPASNRVERTLFGRSTWQQAVKSR